MNRRRTLLGEAGTVLLDGGMGTLLQVQGLDVLLALSTQAFNFFRSKAGFADGVPEDLPAARREKYEQSGRRSKILVKTLRAGVAGAQRSQA